MVVRLSAEDVTALEHAISETHVIGSLIVGDSERERVCAEVARLAAALVTDHSVPERMSIHGTTGRSSEVEYHLTGNYIAGTRGQTPDAIVVLIDRPGAHRLEACELVRRFSLTRREIEAARLLKLGLSTKEIARALGISVNTARRHVEHVLSKLGIHSRCAVAGRLDGN